MSTQIDLNGQSAMNLFDLNGVVAVVTGGGSGIGLMISSTLVANGATVYIIGPKQADLDRICSIYNDASSKLKSGSGGKMYGLEGDISSKTEAKRLAEEVAKMQPYVTVLFNNAGIQAGQFTPPSQASAAAYVSAFFDKIEPQDFNNVLNTNAVGAYWLTFAFLPLLEKWKVSEEGVTKKFVPQVIMTSSMNGWTKDSATSGRSYPYMFSKSAIGHATSSLAHELLPLGIRVNGIAPGLFPTEMSLPGHSNEAGITVSPPDKTWGFEIPTVNTGGTKRDVGALALCLIANWFINGETVLIDGGTLLKHPSSY
ncbi:NAD(P)-binding protein [Lentinula aciculospora]|uniref:NAD(P)-binding protein n=1 Tax=Lentinula aciculospora TaxID=153920 RepID=A0A9W9AT89_9AGAR|nr:NAD(P)-binding protein [Lentinula aciculospora]